MTKEERIAYYNKYAKYRDKKKLTDYRVCKLTGIPTSNIAQWHTGIAMPKIDKLQAIAKVLEIEVTKLI